MDIIKESNMTKQFSDLKLDSHSEPTTDLVNTASIGTFDESYKCRETSKLRLHSTSSIGSTASIRSDVLDSESTSSLDSLDNHDHFDNSQFMYQFETDKLNQEINHKFKPETQKVHEDDLIELLNKNLDIENNQIQLIINNLQDLPTVEQNLSSNLNIIAENSIIGNNKSIESLMYKLKTLNIDFKPIYKSNDGLIVFIKNISPQLIVADIDQNINSNTNKAEKPIILDSTNKFFNYINDLTHFKSLQEIKLFVKPIPPSSSFCILKFANHLDSNHLLENLSSTQNHPDFQNKFNYNNKIPIYANKYINRSFSTNNHKFHCDTIVLSNLFNFFPKDITLIQFKNFINKFKSLAPIDLIYFPITNDQLNIGFIKFKKNVPNLTETCLRILLNLNNMSWQNFNQIDFHFLTDDVNEIETNPQGLQIEFAQQKHNHHLLKNLNNLYISFPFAVYYPNPWIQINNFAQSVNYQETNLYVINIAQIFDNSDDLWLKFWSQFGEVNSAKLINRIGENKKKLNEDEKKIGFVFYKNFNSALKAILKTNNKSISFPDGSSLTIQSSFAIQKSQSYKFPEFDYYLNNFIPPMPMRNIFSSEKNMEIEDLFNEINNWLGSTYI